jgi:hypothetical protein
MRRTVWAVLVVVMVAAAGCAGGGADGVAGDVSPLDIRFRRQAVRRLVFDGDQAIPLSALRPAEVVDLAVEHPTVPVSGAPVTYTVGGGVLTASAGRAGESALWVGGFNPFATYDVAFAGSRGASPEAGVEFATPGNRNRLAVLAIFSAGRCTHVRWRVTVGGEQKEDAVTALDEPVEGPFRLRVQVLGSGLNVYVERDGVSRVVDTRDFAGRIDLRRTEHIRSFEFRYLTRLGAGDAVAVGRVSSSLTTGAGQADVRAITLADGAPLLDQGRLWFTVSVRGRHLPHPLQGVFSLDPSVFDVRLEGIVVFDRGDGLLRNEVASDIFYDKAAGEWRGLTVGFSAYADPDKRIPKQLWAVSSKRDPRFGFSVMRAAAVVMPGAEEDPHMIFDAAAGKWRVLVCTRGEVGFPAALYESDRWDGPYAPLAGPVGVNGTGCLIQKIGTERYALFGSADRKFYVYTYPGLKPLGSLDMFRPPWPDNGGNARCWPNVIPLPDGYPAPYVAVSMDRANYPGLKGWTYGALYLYHGHPEGGGRRRAYEYAGEGDE